MQRIISLQTSRNADRASSEFVTKRLCCSFLFSVAFLSLLGGFLLGRYATDRAILLKNVVLMHKQQTEEKFSHDVMNNLTTLIHNINQSIREVHVENVHAYFYKLNCTDISANTSALAANFEKNIAVKTSRMLNLHLDALSVCFTQVYHFLDELNTHNKTTIVTND